MKNVSLNQIRNALKNEGKSLYVVNLEIKVDQSKEEKIIYVIAECADYAQKQALEKASSLAFASAIRSYQLAKPVTFTVTGCQELKL